MKKCKACEKDIAKGVKKCVHCGKDQRNFFMRHKILTGFLGIVLLVTLVNIGSEDSNQNEASDAVAKDTTEIENDGQESAVENNEDKSETDSDDEVERVKIGDPAEIANVTFTVNNIEETDVIESGNEFIDNAESDGKFVILDITVENDKDDSIMIDSSYFKIITDDDKEYKVTRDFDVMMAMGDEEDDFFLKDINPGLEKDGKIVIEVGENVDVSKSILQAQTGFWGSETVEVSLHE